MMPANIDAAIEATLKALQRRGFSASLAESGEAAGEMVLAMVPLVASVGLGDSATIRQTGVLEALKRRGTIVIDWRAKELTGGTALDNIGMAAIERLLRMTHTCDVFLTGTNAVTLDGKLVNIDRVGNRVSGMFFGPKKVIIVAGRNKIAKDVDDAIDRLKNAIVPAYTRHTHRKTPCAVTGKCNDCHSPDRYCGIMTIIEWKPYLAIDDLAIILVNEDLGLGWDPAWPEERVGAIKARFEDLHRPSQKSGRA